MKEGCLLDEETGKEEKGKEDGEEEGCERTAGGWARVQCLDFEVRVALGE